MLTHVQKADRVIEKHYRNNPAKWRIACDEKDLGKYCRIRNFPNKKYSYQAIFIGLVKNPTCAYKYEILQLREDDTFYKTFAMECTVDCNKDIPQC